MPIVQPNLEKCALTDRLSIGLLASILVLAGCVSNTALTRPRQDTSAVEYTVNLRSETSGGLDNLLGGTLREANRVLDSSSKGAIVRLDERSHQRVDYPSYSGIATWWCPRHAEVSNAAQLTQKYSQLCQQRGGFWSGPYCLSRNREPLFLAAVTQSTKCSGKAGVSVYAVEGKANLRDSDYLTALGASGYKTPQAIMASRVLFIESGHPLYSKLAQEKETPQCKPLRQVELHSQNSLHEVSSSVEREVVRLGGNVFRVEAKGRRFNAEQYNKYGQVSRDAIAPEGDFHMSGLAFHCSNVEGK